MVQIGKSPSVPFCVDGAPLVDIVNHHGAAQQSTAEPCDVEQFSLFDVTWKKNECEM